MRNELKWYETKWTERLSKKILCYFVWVFHGCSCSTKRLLYFSNRFLSYSLFFSPSHHFSWAKWEMCVPWKQSISRWTLESVRYIRLDVCAHIFFAFSFVCSIGEDDDVEKILCGVNLVQVIFSIIISIEIYYLFVRLPSIVLIKWWTSCNLTEENYICY